MKRVYANGLLDFRQPILDFSAVDIGSFLIDSSVVVLPNVEGFVSDGSC